MRRIFWFSTAIFILGFVTSGVAQTAGPTLKRITAFDLPGAAGKRFDYLTIDEGDHYLISAHLAARQTYVIDAGTNKVVAIVTDTTQRHYEMDNASACQSGSGRLPMVDPRFIDPEAQFLFVDESQLLESAARESAFPFDAPAFTSETKPSGSALFFRGHPAWSGWP